MKEFCSAVLLLGLLFPLAGHAQLSGNNTKDDFGLQSAGSNAQDIESDTAESAVESAPVALDPSLPPKVSEVLTSMANFLERTLMFTGTANFAGDVLRTDGHVQEGGGTVSLLIHAPLRAKITIRDRTGSISVTILDGETLTVGAEKDSQFYYDSIRQPGDITESLDFLAEDLGVPRPWQGIMSGNVLAMFADVSSGSFVGETTIGGLLCDHLLLHTDTQDIQLWVTQGNQPAPVRLLKIHRESQGQLRELVMFSSWDFSPDLPADSFALQLPDNAERFHFFQDRPDNGTK